MAEQKSLGLMFLNRVRTSYLYCYEAFVGKPTPQQPNPKPIYKSDFLIAPNHPDLARIAAKIDEVGAAHQWKGGLTWEQAKTAIKANNALCLKRGETIAPGDPVYANMFVLKGSNKTPFSIFDGSRMPIPAGKPHSPMSGDWVNAMVDIWAQDNEWGRRINCTITGIQFVEKDVNFGGGARPADPDEFPMIAGGADAPTPAAAGADPLAGLV